MYHRAGGQSRCRFTMGKSHHVSRDIKPGTLESNTSDVFVPSERAVLKRAENRRNRKLKKEPDTGVRIKVYPGDEGYCYLSLEYGQDWVAASNRLGKSPSLRALGKDLVGTQYPHNSTLTIEWKQKAGGLYFHLARVQKHNKLRTTTLRTALLDMHVIAEELGFKTTECWVGGYERIPTQDAVEESKPGRRVSFEDERKTLPSMAPRHRRAVSVGRSNAIRRKSAEVSPLSDIPSALEVEEPLTTFGDEVNSAFETFHKADLRGRARSVSRTRKEVDGRATDVTVIIEKSARPSLSLRTSAVSSQTSLKPFVMEKEPDTPALSEFSDFLDSQAVTDRSSWTKIPLSVRPHLEDKTVNDMLDDPAETFEHMDVKMQSHKGWTQKEIERGLLRTGAEAKSPVVPMDPARVVKRGGVTQKTTCFYEALRSTLTPSYWNSLDPKVTSPGELPWSVYRYAAWVCNDKRHDQRCFLVEIGKAVGLDDKGDIIRQDHIEYLGSRKMVRSTRGLPLGMEFGSSMHSRMTSDGSSIKMLMFGHELFPMNPRHCSFRQGISFLSAFPDLGSSATLVFKKSSPQYTGLPEYWPRATLTWAAGDAITPGEVLYTLMSHHYSESEGERFIDECQTARKLIFRSETRDTLVVDVTAGFIDGFSPAQKMLKGFFMLEASYLDQERLSQSLKDATETLNASEDALAGMTDKHNAVRAELRDYVTRAEARETTHDCRSTCGHNHQDFAAPDQCSYYCPHPGMEPRHTVRDCGRNVSRFDEEFRIRIVGLDRGSYHDGTFVTCPTAHTQNDCNDACNKQHGQASIVEVTRERTHKERIDDKELDSKGCVAAQFTMQSRIDYEAARARKANGERLLLAKERAAMVRPTFSRGNWLERPFSSGKLKLAAHTFHLPKHVIPLVNVRGKVMNGKEKIFDGLWSDWVCTPQGLKLFYTHQDAANKKKFAHAFGMSQDTLEGILPSSSYGMVHVTHRDTYDSVLEAGRTKLSVGMKCT